MGLQLPENSDEIVQRGLTDVQRELNTSNPFLKNSAIRSIVVASMRRIYDFYLMLGIATRELIWSTATGAYLALWASIFKIFRLSATPAAGTIVITGTAGNSVNANTILTSSDGQQYTTLTSATIASVSTNIASLNGADVTAKAETAAPHGLASGITLTISGATETEFNGSFSITVTSETEFTYTMASPYTGAATGSPTLAADYASVGVESSDTGSATNQDAGAALSFLSPQAGIDNTGYVDFGAIGGGSDLESDADFRARLLDRTRNPVANFNDAAITAQAKQVNGVTRVYVRDITPEIGMVTVYFTRDNDSDIIPTSSEVDTVKDKILEIKPASTWDEDVVVVAPAALPVDFVFTSLSPDTPAMREAVEANLDALFREQTDVGVRLESDAYRSVIWSTIEPTTGDQVSEFALNTPTGDIVPVASQIPTLGSVTFAI